MNEREFADALNTLMAKLSAKGWIESVAISQGTFQIRYTPKGEVRLQSLKDIFVDDLQEPLQPNEHQALFFLARAFPGIGGQTP